MINLTYATWRKSSYSGGQGGDCVEVADALSVAPVGDSADLDWRKSSYSSGQGGECVEVADGLAVVPVRDSKDPDGPVLVFPAAAWSSFVADLKADRFPAV